MGKQSSSRSSGKPAHKPAKTSSMKAGVGPAIYGAGNDADTSDAASTMSHELKLSAKMRQLQRDVENELSGN